MKYLLDRYMSCSDSLLTGFTDQDGYVNGLYTLELEYNV